MLGARKTDTIHAVSHGPTPVALNSLMRSPSACVLSHFHPLSHVNQASHIKASNIEAAAHIYYTVSKTSSAVKALRTFHPWLQSPTKAAISLFAFPVSLLSISHEGQFLIGCPLTLLLFDVVASASYFHCNSYDSFTFLQLSHAFDYKAQE